MVQSLTPTSLRQYDLPFPKMGIRDAPNEDVAFRQISLALVGNAHLSCAYLKMIYWPSSDPVVGVYGRRGRS